MHSYHDVLPGYHPDQVLHDGCGECEHRAASRNHGISDMDETTFLRAWQRAARWNQRGLPNVSQAEVPALDALWAVQLHLERRGIPIGQLPGQTDSWLT